MFRSSRSRIFSLGLLLCLPTASIFAAPRLTDAASAADAAPQTKSSITIAIADFDGSDKELAHFLADTLLTNLQQTGKFNLVERAALRQALAELKLQANGFAEPQQIKKLGGLVSADHLIVGSFMLQSDDLTINARLLNVKTGRLEPGGAASVSGSRKDFAGLVGRLAQEFALHFTGEAAAAETASPLAAPVSPVIAAAPAAPEVPAPPMAQAQNVSPAPEAPLGNLLTHFQDEGLVPMSALPDGEVSERDLAQVVGRIARRLSTASGYTLASSQPRLPVTRVRVLAALMKLAKSPAALADYRADLSRLRPVDGDSAPTWGLPYLAAALEGGWIRTDEPFHPRSVANWTFVCSLLAHLPLIGAPTPAVSVAVVRPAPPREIAPVNEDYTGLIVDADDFNAQRGMNARIVDEQGKAVYPAEGQVLDLDFLEERGIVGYCETAGTAARAGAHPLTVHAIGLSGTSRTELIVSNATAEQIRAAQRRNKFFERWAVCFLVHTAAK